MMPIQFSDAAANRVAQLIDDEASLLRVYITGGGCSGFQYGFRFESESAPDDMVVENNGVQLVVDPMSLQYLIGGTVDYTEGLAGSYFYVDNPNAVTTCGCGSSFSV